MNLNNIKLIEGGAPAPHSRTSKFSMSSWKCLVRFCWNLCLFIFTGLMPPLLSLSLLTDSYQWSYAGHLHGASHSSVHSSTLHHNLCPSPGSPLLPLSPVYWQCTRPYPMAFGRPSCPPPCNWANLHQFATTNFIPRIKTTTILPGVDHLPSTRSESSELWYQSDAEKIKQRFINCIYQSNWV